ncbi:MAG: hypothetical protein WBF56_00650 [Candidatus Acidiferrales bacterium]
MKVRPGITIAIMASTIAAALALPRASLAQNPAADTPGINSGDYNIQQTIEAGYRGSWINGNKDTYDTFENLGSGLRLFDYSLQMRSLDHRGIFFDTLTFSNFGYGGDPNDVSRLRIQKDKYYDFRLLFRRDKNFWDYNLFANPLNPASLNPPGSTTTGCYATPVGAPPVVRPVVCSSPANAITNSPHALDLVRRMQDYDLTLMPQSRIQVRLGYSRNRDEGPGFFTTDGGTISDFNQTYSYTTNAYRAGVDFKILPRTTISYDQFLNYFKQDNVVTDNPAVNPQNYGFILANSSGLGTPNGTPVDLGNIWSTQTPAEVLPCAAPIMAGTVNTANPTCNGYLSYSQVSNPRNFMPTERLRFQSNYFRSFEMSGSLGYSTSNSEIPDFFENVNGYTARTAERGSTTGGPANAKRVSVNANWSGVYAVTEKLRILDEFRYDNWRIPGTWALDETNIFGTGYPGLAGLQQNEAVFNTTNCPLGSNAVTCPQHTASSAADAIRGLASTFLGQNLKSNTLEFDYDFNRRVSAHIGYLYTNRTISQFSDANDTESIYFPGGATATPANDYLAARGSCAAVAGALPAGCTLNADGSVTFLAPATASPTRSVLTINENALVLGALLRPIAALRITGDLEFGYNDNSYTRIDPRQVQSYKLHANYKPRPWATVDGAIEIHENRDDITDVDNLEHDRSYSFATTLIPNPRLSVDFGYNYWNVFSQSLICFAYSTSVTNPAPPPATLPVSAFPIGVPMLPTGPDCPIAGASSPLGALSTYSSNDHFVHAGVIWKPTRRLTTMLGYGGSFVRGNTIFLNPLTPSGTLDFNYQKPYVSVAIDVYKGLSYKMAWDYFGFNEVGNSSPFGLATIPLTDFNGSNAAFSLRYSF